jgi:hypothetical protein
MRVYYILIGWGLLLTGCSKKSNQEKDSQAPVITLTAPVNGQVFTAGQSIAIAGSITDDNYIAEVHLHVYNMNTSSLLMDVHLYPASPSAAFNQSIIASAGVAYKIQVIAKDKEINEASQTIMVSCN